MKKMLAPAKSAVSSVFSGLFTNCVLSPGVAPGCQRIRMCLMATHSMEDLEKHREMPYLKAFKQKAGSLLAKPLEVTLLEMIREK